jgi:hypothetical protein
MLKLRAALLTVLMIACVGLLAAPAQAATPNTVSSTYCSGKSQNTVVKNYTRGSRTYTLRCGTSTWGFVHVVGYGRWNAAYDTEIALTVAQGDLTSGTADTSGVYTYYADGACSSPTFTVVFNQGALNGNGIRPQGIITAYWNTVSTIVPSGCEPV